MNNYIELAYKATSGSTHKQQHMAAVVVRGGAVLSIAHNMHNRNKCCERRALRPHLDLKGATIIVVRKNRGISKPCKLCQDAIKRAGIKKVVYIDQHGDVVIVKASELK